MKKGGDKITVNVDDYHCRVVDSVYKTEGLECLAAQGFPTQYAGFLHKGEIHVMAPDKTADQFREACEACCVRTEVVYRYPRPLLGGYAAQNKMLAWSRCPVSELK